MKRIAIDSSPVTNAQYKEFLHATNYQPRFSENFLKHWINGEIPVGTEQEPVVYVDLDDARLMLNGWENVCHGKKNGNWP